MSAQLNQLLMGNARSIAIDAHHITCSANELAYSICKPLARTRAAVCQPWLSTSNTSTAPTASTLSCWLYAGKMQVPLSDQALLGGPCT